MLYLMPIRSQALPVTHAMAGETWGGLGTSCHLAGYQTSFQSQICSFEQCWQDTVLCKVQQRLSPSCCGISIPPGHRRLRATWSCWGKETQISGFFLFFPVFIYFRYSVSAIRTAQVRGCQHFPSRLLFPGDGNLIATFVPDSNRPRRGLTAKASSSHLETTATTTHSLGDQFKMMEVDKKH